MEEWSGGDVDPERFDRRGVNHALWWWAKPEATSPPPSLQSPLAEAIRPLHGQGPVVGFAAA